MATVQDWDPFADPAEAAAADPGPVAAAPATPQPLAGANQSKWYADRPVVSGRKPRVVVLHGTCSSSAVMKGQLVRFATLCKDKVDLFYVSGSIPSEKDNPQYVTMSKVFPGEDFFQYVLYAPKRADGGMDYEGLEVASHLILSEIEQLLPIDGILGFSQGSNVASVLAAQAVAGCGHPLSCVIHMAGSIPGWTWRFPELFQEPLRIPSLHVFGEKDQFWEGPCLKDLYVEPIVLSHTGDHRPLPRDAAEADALAAKMLDFLLNSTKG